jgi:hypothetical protein
VPNLGLFADAGFPFTQMADLSETTVIIPEVPSADKISLYLHLMSHFGAQTDHPALCVTVDGPNTVLRSVDVATYHGVNICSYAIMRIWLTQQFMLHLISVMTLGFLVAIWTREWLSQRARKRLRLAERMTSAS